MSCDDTGENALGWLVMLICKGSWLQYKQAQDIVSIGCRRQTAKEPACLSDCRRCVCGGSRRNCRPPVVCAVQSTRHSLRLWWCSTGWIFGKLFTVYTCSSLQIWQSGGAQQQLMPMFGLDSWIVVFKLVIQDTSSEQVFAGCRQLPIQCNCANMSDL